MAESPMISILLSARPSWAKLRPVVARLIEGGAQVEVVAAGAALLHRYGAVVEQVRCDFPTVPVVPIYCTYEGATLITSAKETGSLLSSLAEHYVRTKPSLVVVMADRHETVAASMAACYLNIPVAHIQGGEISGNIDDRVRDANTAFATYHFPSTARAETRLANMVQRGSEIYRYGCPSIDIAKSVAEDFPVVSTHELGGTGPHFDLVSPFLLVVLHPETERPLAAYEQMGTVMAASRWIRLPRLILWPGQDAGQEGGAKAIREMMTQHPEDTWHAVRTIPPHRFLRLLRQATVLVGNSSVGVRECAFLGTPVVNVGIRQLGRERAGNVLDCPLFDEKQIEHAIRAQCSHGPYLSSPLYGRGDAAPRIARKLIEIVCS